MKGRYNKAVDFFREKYGSRLQKIVIDAGFSCPNRDGRTGKGGCTYCDNNAFHPSYSTPDKTITLQIEEGITFHKNRYRNSDLFLAYFQSYSNTNAPLERLKKLYEEALQHEKVAGIVIATRPDCIDLKKLEYLRDLSKETIVIIEYGVESVYDKTLKRVNRGHSFRQAEEAIYATANMGIVQGAHFIFGLPGESIEEMISYSTYINRLPIETVKFHQLQIIKGTAMEREFSERPEDFLTFSMDGYIDFFVTFLERLRADIAIERFASEVPPRFVNSTPWGKIRNPELLKLLENRLEERETYQSKLFSLSLQNNM